MRALLRIQKRVSAFCVPLDNDFALGVGKLRDGDLYLVAEECVLYVLAPLDGAHRAAVEVILPADVEQLVRAG